MNGFDAKCAMEFGFQINRGTLGSFAHDHHLRTFCNIIML
jgi:hypothetical protein